MHRTRRHCQCVWCVTARAREERRCRPADFPPHRSRASHRRAVAGLILALSLAIGAALPAVALGASSSGSTSETLTVGATISFTTPASTTYVASGNPDEYRADFAQSASTNNPTGFTLKVTASALVNGGTTIPTTDRKVEPGSAPAGVTFTPIAYGGIANSSTAYPIASTSAPSSPSLTWTFSVRNATVAGAYSGTLAFTASTNP